MPLDLDDIIAAQASAAGAAERGIIRISGSGIGEMLGQIFQPDNTGETLNSARRPVRFEGTADVPQLGTPLPAALMYWPTRRSFTGQPMAEFHTIGSPPVLDALLERVLECGARPARRGEFTMRAFLAGRIDLLQAEAVLGVIEATDHQELMQALNQLGGGITNQLAAVRSDLIAVLGDLEAGLDFVEEDIEFITSEEIVRRLTACHDILRLLLSDSDTRLASGWKRRVVLAGLPNAGKSTLFNRLVGRNKAIVSPVPGTTRDYLSSALVLTGTSGRVEVELIDTAGVEAAEDLIMGRAQQLRGQQTETGDLIVWCRSARFSAAERTEDARLRQSLPTLSAAVLPVITQIDFAEQAFDESTAGDWSEPGDLRSWPCVSAETGTGIEELTRLIADRLLNSRSGRGELLTSTSVRCRDSLKRCLAAVESATEAAVAAAGDELISMDLRQALHELSVVMGEVYTDDILDHIFSQFCIGK